MRTYSAKVYVRLKGGILDPQGKAVEHALSALGFNGVEEVRVGKLIEFSIQAENDEAANEQVKKSCDQLLANPVIEDYDFELGGSEA